MSEDFEYGVQQDIERLIDLIFRGGQTNCKLNRMPNGHIENMENARVCDIDHPLASTVTARYYKGIGTHKDNMVIEVYKLEIKDV